VRDEPEQVDCV